MTKTNVRPAMRGRNLLNRTSLRPWRSLRKELLTAKFAKPAQGTQRRPGIPWKLACRSNPA